MRDFRNAKAMAQTLRNALKARSVSISHSESLELVAKILGFRDWNVLAARIQFESKELVGETDTAAARTAPPPADAGLPLVPLRDLVLFPQMTVPILVGREKSKRAVERAVSTDRRILAVAQRRALDDDPALNDLYRVGVTASVIETLTLPDGTLKLFVTGQDRAAVRHFIDGKFLTGEATAVEELRTQAAEAIALSQAVIEAFQTYATRKRELQKRLTAQLPEWFGRPDANAEYARQAEVLDGYVAEIDHDPRGLLLLKRSSAISAEVYWMGVDPKFHSRGIGRALVTAASEAAHKRGVKFLFVATLHPDDPYEPYQRTRGFYESLGFVYVLEEQFPADPNNRIAYYMKDISA